MMGQFLELIDIQIALEDKRKALRRSARLKRRKAKRLIEKGCRNLTTAKIVRDVEKSTELETKARDLESEAFTLALRIGNIKAELQRLAGASAHSAKK